MIELRDIANPVIQPESVIVVSQTASIDDTALSKFKDYLGIVHNTEDPNLRFLLLTRFREVGLPTSLGINLNVQTWKMVVDLGGCDYVYLPRFNGMNVSTIDYDVDDNVISTPSWETVKLAERVDNIPLMQNNGDERPVRTEFTWTVGFNFNQYPLEILQMIFMECAFRRDFPLGVDDRGQRVEEMPQSVEYTRASWRMINDLSYYV